MIPQQWFLWSLYSYIIKEKPAHLDFIIKIILNYIQSSNVILTLRLKVLHSATFLQNSHSESRWKKLKTIIYFLWRLLIWLYFYFPETQLEIEFHACSVLTQLLSGAERNFHKYPRSTIDSLGTRYDYGSLMHYRSTAFSKNGRPTIVPKRSGVCFDGNLKLSSEHLTLQWLNKKAI